MGGCQRHRGDDLTRRMSMLKDVTHYDSYVVRAARFRLSEPELNSCGLAVSTFYRGIKCLTCSLVLCTLYSVFIEVPTLVLETEAVVMNRIFFQIIFFFFFLI